MNIKLNDAFCATQTDEQFYLVRVIEKQAGKKLSRPIYEFAYTNRDYNNFTCYIEDINKSIWFGSWEKIN